MFARCIVDCGVISNDDIVTSSDGRVLNMFTTSKTEICKKIPECHGNCFDVMEIVMYDADVRWREMETNVGDE